ncbi:MAG: metal-sulfur cluster assembly factor [Nitrososphaerales archaeon]
MATTPENDPLKDQVMNALKNCYDPEIPVNLVDLGLIYGVNVNDGNVQVTMTLTAPGCGMGPHIAQNVKDEVGKVEGVKDTEVDMVWEPQWSPERMSDAAKAQLGFI